MAYKLPPLSTLRVFEAAARHGSFRAAAEELLLTPGAVSRSVQSLEDWLGTPLFTRGNRSVSLTDAGAAYVAPVRAALDVLARGTEAVPGRRPGGSLTISAAPTFGLRWLIPRLRRFKAAHRGIAIMLDTAHRQVEFPRDGVDLAIRMGTGPWPGLEALHLVTESLVPVCAPALAPSIREPGDLAGATLLHVTQVSREWAYWAEARGLAGPDTTRGLRFDNVQYALNAAIEGLGVALGRHPLVDPDLASGALVAVLGPAVPAATSYWLVCTPESLARSDVRAFRDWIRDELAPQPAGRHALTR
ncbi:transcriptional regulator GcvA [Azospirillum halopraeferens]|uniref:transcriptional regulator GcvA n=1 Tax=Azospirillum halopraeferens TaxID=34010 RepID=UPI0005513259|nr:transcriptional regulator GcvA [Azospirillum halopraeferens]